MKKRKENKWKCQSRPAWELRGLWESLITRRDGHTREGVFHFRETIFFTFSNARHPVNFSRRNMNHARYSRYLPPGLLGPWISVITSLASFPVCLGAVPSIKRVSAATYALCTVYSAARQHGYLSQDVPSLFCEKGPGAEGTYRLRYLHRPTQELFPLSL